MFRFNWPTSELLFGQYFSMFCEWYAESAEDGPLQMTGTPTARLAQIRFTQKFLSDWTVAGLIGDPNQALLNGTDCCSDPITPLSTTASRRKPRRSRGKSSTPTTSGVRPPITASPLPSRFSSSAAGSATSCGSALSAAVASVGAGAFGGQQLSVAGSCDHHRNQYVNPWLAMGSLFIPVIPTQSANLAGTASILTQWWIGQGVEAFGFTGRRRQHSGLTTADFLSGRCLQPQIRRRVAEQIRRFCRGPVLLQQPVVRQRPLRRQQGFQRVPRLRGSNARTINGSGDRSSTTANEPQTIQQMSATLWYRPIQAIKFGLQYSYLAANYFQMNTAPGNTPNSSRFGDDHRVEFVGFFYF